MVLFGSLSRLDSKSLERASMDYEAPLMPCGCILLPGSGMLPRESEAEGGSTQTWEQPGAHCLSVDWACGGSKKDPAERGWKRDR